MNRFSLALVCLFGLLATGCAGQETNAPATPTPLPTPVVPRKPIYEVTRGDVVEVMQFMGRVVPVVESSLAFDREGRVAHVYVQEGDPVEAGTLLADLQELGELLRGQEEQRLNVRRAELNKEIAALGLEAYELTADAEAPDFEQQMGILKRQIELADIALQEAQFDLEALEAGIAAVRLVAPLDGVVRGLSLREGDPVAAFEPLIVVADMSELEVSAELSSSELAALEEDMPVLLEPTRAPGVSFAGVVRQLPYEASGGSTEAVGADETLRITLEVSVAELGLEAGDRVRGTIVLAESEDTLWLPPQAIRAFEGRHFVIVQDGNRQQRVDITLGIQGDGRVEVLSGLASGQEVVGP